LNNWFDDSSGAIVNYGHISNWDVSQVTNMSELFEEKTTFNEDISNWDVSNVTSMHYMFKVANAFNQPIGSWNVSKVTDMESMFWFAYDFNQDISNWNVSQVSNMKKMFDRADAFNMPLNNWNVFNLTTMENMFMNAASFNQDISDWNLDTSGVNYSLYGEGAGHSDHLFVESNLYYFNVNPSYKINVSTTVPTDDENTGATDYNVSGIYGIFVSILTQDDQDILSDQLLYRSINKGDTFSKTFVITPIELHDYIKVKMHNNSTDGVYFKNVTITFNYMYSTIEYVFTNADDTSTSKVGTNNTVGWLDFDTATPHTRYYTNINKPYDISISATASSVADAGTVGTMYVSFLTTEGNNILVDQELFNTISGGVTKIKEFNLPGLYDIIQVQLYTTNSDGVALSEVKITYNDVIHIFTTENNTITSGNGVDNTVGWFDTGDGAMGPNNRIYTNISKPYNISISTTASTIDNADTVARIYVSFLTTEGNNILVDQELFTGLNKNETKTETFSLPAIYDNIQVQIYTTNTDGFALSEVKITYNDVIHIFTNVDNTNNDGNGVNNTVGWFDFGMLAHEPDWPHTRTYTNISNS